jgi:hypothetical protein
LKGIDANTTDRLKGINANSMDCLKGIDAAMANSKGINSNCSWKKLASKDTAPDSRGALAACCHGHGINEMRRPCTDSEEKLVVVTQENAAANSHDANAARDADAQDRFGASLPFSHYLSKLKELSGRQSASAAAAGANLAMDLREQASDPKMRQRDRSASIANCAADADESLETSPRSDAFSEALTYSNPVFDLGSEQMLEEKGLPNLQTIGGSTTEGEAGFPQILCLNASNLCKKKKQHVMQILHTPFDRINLILFHRFCKIKAP